MNRDHRLLVEDHYGVAYQGHIDTPEYEGGVDVFYQDDPDTGKGHTHYMGMYYNWRKSRWFKIDASHLISEQ